MSAQFKKTAEIMFYLLAEIGIAFLIVYGAGLPEVVTVPMGAVMVYLGKVIIQSLKEGAIDEYTEKQ